jgi:hypothetical protein
VAIKASSSKQIDALIADLGADNAVTRETAVARLTLLGARAVERLIAAAGAGAHADSQAGAWRALEAIGDAARSNRRSPRWQLPRRSRLSRLQPPASRACTCAARAAPRRSIGSRPSCSIGRAT